MILSNIDYLSLKESSTNSLIIAIPVVTAESERRALIESFGAKKVKTILIPEVVSSILDESNFGLIYLAHTFTEVSIVENNSLQKYTFGNIGLDDLSKSMIEGVSPSLITGEVMRRKALESLMNEHDFKLHGWHINTALPLEVTLTMSNLKQYSAPWISSIHKLFTKLSMSNFKWYVISDYGQLNVIAKLISGECSVRIYPINDSQELIAKELSIMDFWTRK